MGLGSLILEKLLVGGEADTLMSLEKDSREDLKIKEIRNAYNSLTQGPTIKKVWTICFKVGKVSLNSKDSTLKNRLEDLKRRTLRVKQELEVELSKPKEKKDETKLNRLLLKLRDIISRE